jgi:hypothetical protein
MTAHEVIGAVWAMTSSTRSAERSRKASLRFQLRSHVPVVRTSRRHIGVRTERALAANA